MKKPIQVDRYLCHRKIGTGGMAEIYQARLTGSRGFTKEVAIKLMHRHLATNPAVVDLFVNEARITGGLDHPNIVTVFELGKHESQLFMVMEYVDGLDLGTLLARLVAEGRPMRWDLALAMAMEVTRALQFVHACVPGRLGRTAPVVHRDLSPGNVMVSRSGSVKLLDFGVAKTLMGDDDTDNIARGKWHYMSPEQVRGEQLDGRSDLFSLGAVLFELLTGRQAFKGQTVVDSMRKVEQADLPPAPDLEPVLEELLTKLLARDRDQRYTNACEALDAMAQVMMLRGTTTGQRQIATLLHDLDERSRPAVAEAAGGPVLAAVDSQYLGVGDQTDIRTIPQRNPDARNNAVEDKTLPGEATLPGETTLPTALGSPRARFKLQGPLRAAAADIDEEPTEVTDEQLTNPTGSRLSRRITTEATPVGDDDLSMNAPGDPDEPNEPDEPDEPEEPVPESPDPQETSVPQVYFDHFMPGDEVEEVTVTPRTWTGRNLVVLILAVLAIVIAGVAIFIAIGQRRGRPRSRAATTRAAHPGTPPRKVDAGVTDSGADARAAQVDAQSRPSPRPRPTVAPRPRPTAVAPGGTVPMQGPLVKGRLDVITTPPGVRVYVNGTYRGTSPLRAVAPAGRRIRVVLSRAGRGLYKTRMWMPAAVGRRLKILMPFLLKPFRKARPGRTALKVTCKTEGLNRVYIDGRDTGHDCPTPPLEVLPVVHFVALYLPTTGKTVWRKLRPKARQVTEVSWDH